MNKTNNNYAKENYASPMATSIEISAESVLCTSNEGRADKGYRDNDLGRI